MTNLFEASKLFFKRNGSFILTCIGAVGVVATSITAVKATPKAIKLIEKREQEKGEKLTVLETIKVAGPAYIPSLSIGASTIACIFVANGLNKKQQASIMSAYALLDTSYKEYKRKVEEIYGEETDKLVKEGISKDKYDESVEVVDSDKELFFDFYSLRYFSVSIDQLMNAENCINEVLSKRGYVSLNEFYELVDLPPVDFGYNQGWNWEECNYIVFKHEKTRMDDGLECTILSMDLEPDSYIY